MILIFPPPYIHNSTLAIKICYVNKISRTSPITDVNIIIFNISLATLLLKTRNIRTRPPTITYICVICEVQQNYFSRFRGGKSEDMCTIKSSFFCNRYFHATGTINVFCRLYIQIDRSWIRCSKVERNWGDCGDNSEALRICMYIYLIKQIYTYDIGTLKRTIQLLGFMYFDKCFNSHRILKVQLNFSFQCI